MTINPRSPDNETNIEYGEGPGLAKTLTVIKDEGEMGEREVEESFKRDTDGTGLATDR